MEPSIPGDTHHNKFLRDMLCDILRRLAFVTPPSGTACQLHHHTMEPSIPGDIHHNKFGYSYFWVVFHI
jgi:hypothetical protein